MYAFTNRFSGPTLRQRIGMINRPPSNSLGWWRYIVWVLLLAAMVFACRHETDHEETTARLPDFPVTNATRALAAELEQADTPWFRQASLLMFDKPVIMNGRRVTIMAGNTYPQILALHANHLALKNVYDLQVKTFINGQPAPAKALSALTFENVDEIFVYQKWEDLPGADQFPETYRVFVSTTHKTPKPSLIRTKWKQYLLANAVSDYPLGKSSTFSMNKLLEATFFHNKLAFVERTKEDYLKLYDEYTADIDLYINGLPVEPKNIESVHVREVNKLYTRERSFEEWADSPDKQHRFILFIQTEPKRAKRDRTYYVFSPFYSGDF